MAGKKKSATTSTDKSSAEVYLEVTGKALIDILTSVQDKVRHDHPSVVMDFIDDIIRNVEDATNQ